MVIVGKKIRVLLSVCVLLCGLCACQNSSTISVTTLPTLPETGDVTLGSVQRKGTEELTELLARIQTNVAPGSAGCTMHAVPYAVELLDWCKSAGISESVLCQSVEDWLQGKDAQEIREKFCLLFDTCQLLTGPAGEDLLESAGCETDSYPWSEATVQIAASIFESAGVDTGEKE